MLRLTLDKSPAVKPDAKVYSADDNVRLNSTRRGKRSKVGILEVSEGVEVCLLLVILSQFDVEEAMNAMRSIIYDTARKQRMKTNNAGHALAAKLFVFPAC